MSEGSEAECQNCHKTIPATEPRLKYDDHKKTTYHVSKSCCQECLDKLIADAKKKREALLQRNPEESGWS